MPHPSVREQGQTLVELMVAMSVMSIGLLGVFAVLSQSLGLNRVIANQYIATNLAAEGIEIVKNIADSNVVSGKSWNDGLVEDGDFGVQYNSPINPGDRPLNRDWDDQSLKFNAATGIYSYDEGTETNFKRIISIKNISSDEIRVTSRVEWADRGGTRFSVNLEDRLFNWHQ